MRTSAIVGLAAAAVGVLIGSQLPREVVSAPVSITTFKIKVPFDQWAAGFDSKEADQMHKANAIKPLFRGVNIDDPTKVVVIHQSRPGFVEKILFENKKMIEAGGHIMKTTRTTNWSSQ
ncbi:DUF3764 family protein [Prochlorococcus sp. MIT 1300]|uniref:DUF3764 family protein n=1 Tax=Prochlorococcus sp. MIT 1300 TaxID=3096218 RepID=UPI002A7492F7|nr:DUF3764 family protein [Prochlorococcus sp. MIT 1300]